MLLLIEKRTDILIDQTRTQPQGTLEFRMIRQMKIFSFLPIINLSEEGKWLLAETSFEATNSVLIITDENNGFSITIPQYWHPPGSEGTINGLNRLLQLRPLNDIELHVKELERRGTLKQIGEIEYKLSDLDFHKNERIEKLKSIRYNDLENMVFRMQLTYHEIKVIVDINYINAKTVGYTLPPRTYEITDIKLLLKSLLPNEVKVNFTNDDIRLRSNLTSNKKNN